MLAHPKIGFVGAGKMASALAQGFVRSGLVSAGELVANDVAQAAREDFARTVGARVLASNLEVASCATVIVLAVKPPQIRPVLIELSAALTPDHLVVSIAAGIPLSALEACLRPGTRVVRVMPNTPTLVGAGASAFACGQGASRDDAALVQRLFAATGTVCEVAEAQLDAVTGLSGSGPAYGFLIIEALSDGGVAAGLARDIALRLAAQTMLGAARMVLETGLHPGALRDMVTSPGGTTIEGLHELEKGRVRAALINAVRAAAEKSKRLASG
jgi:pyrroline-5-carboxylate reductase